MVISDIFTLKVLTPTRLTWPSTLTNTCFLLQLGEAYLDRPSRLLHLAKPFVFRPSIFDPVFLQKEKENPGYIGSTQGRAAIVIASCLCNTPTISRLHLPESPTRSTLSLPIVATHLLRLFIRVNLPPGQP